MKLKTGHIVIGGVLVAAVAAVALYSGSKGHHMKARYAGYGTGKFHPAPAVGDEKFRAHLARKDGPPGHGDSGITNVGQYDSGGVKWRGWQASPWSPLTARNENYTYSHPPTNRLLRPAGAGKLEHMKLQGATGLTRYLPGITYTYW